MRQRIIEPLHLFERFALQELRKHYPAKVINSPMVSKGGRTKKRTRGENLVDWVKANWTFNEKTMTLDGIIVWTECVGTIYHHPSEGDTIASNLARWADLRAVAGALLNAHQLYRRNGGER